MKIKYAIFDTFSLVALIAIAMLILESTKVISNSMPSIASNSTWIDSILINLLSSIIFTALIAVIGYLLFQWRFKTMLAGSYECGFLNGNTNTPWGTCILKYHPITSTYEFILTHKNGDDKLYGKGTFVRNEYFVGTYGEPNNPLRRRCGSFFLVLDGNGKGFKGKNLAIDPTNTTHYPSVEDIIWTKVNG